MLHMWNERYKNEEYVYGREPNKFFSCELNKLDAGKILLPAEGEGRNAVFAAISGWKVNAFDFSPTAKEKAIRLALENKVNIDYEVFSFEEMNYEPEIFDCIALLFVHQPPEARSKYHKKLLSFLKPEGTIILEGYSKEQLKHKSGGPNNSNLLFSKQELESDFNSLSFYDISVIETNLNEGLLHNGKSSLIRMIGTK